MYFKPNAFTSWSCFKYDSFHWIKVIIIVGYKVSCYCQLSASDLTLCFGLDKLLDSNTSVWFIRSAPSLCRCPQGAIWSSLLFNCYIHLLSSIPRHCLVTGYADYHILLTTIPHKDNSVTAAARLNANLAALCEYGQHWNIKFAALKTFH